MHTSTENLCFGQNADTSYTINFHLHVRVTVRIAKVGQMGSPCSIFCVALDNDRILIQCVGQGQCSLGLLPRVEIVRLLASKPIWERSPDIWTRQHLQNS